MPQLEQKRTLRVRSCVWLVWGRIASFVALPWLLRSWRSRLRVPKRLERARKGPKTAWKAPFSVHEWCCGMPFPVALRKQKALGTWQSHLFAT